MVEATNKATGQKLTITDHAHQRWNERAAGTETSSPSITEALEQAIPYGGQRWEDSLLLYGEIAFAINRKGYVRTCLTKTQAIANMQIRGIVGQHHDPISQELRKAALTADQKAKAELMISEARKLAEMTDETLAALRKDLDESTAEYRGTDYAGKLRDAKAKIQRESIKRKEQRQKQAMQSDQTKLKSALFDTLDVETLCKVFNRLRQLEAGEAGDIEAGKAKAREVREIMRAEAASKPKLDRPAQTA